MNAAISQYDGHGFDYKVEFRRARSPSAKAPSAGTANTPRFRRRRQGGYPVQFNETQRRQIRRIRW